MAEPSTSSDPKPARSAARTGAPRRHAPRERHRTGRVGWLRAVVLGADDGIVSTAGLVVGVAASNAARSSVLVAGTLGLVAGAMSMAAGEYVSVASQRDTEKADIARERHEQVAFPDAELEELTRIYQQRGLERELARNVAEQLTERDAVAAHLRDELGIDPTSLAQPLQAAFASMSSFVLGALVPVLAVTVASRSLRVPVVLAASLLLLALTGVIGARLGGSNRLRGAVRVLLGGGLAMAVSIAIGATVGAAIS